MSQITAETQAPPPEPTEHPHVVRTPGGGGGRPHVRGTGLSVELLAGFYRMGVAPDELLLVYPQLSAAALYDALSYYHDHRPELDAAPDERDNLERLQARYGFSVGERGRVRFDAAPPPRELTPPDADQHAGGGRAG